MPKVIRKGKVIIDGKEINIGDFDDSRSWSKAKKGYS